MYLTNANDRHTEIKENKVLMYSNILLLEKDAAAAKKDAINNEKKTRINLFFLSMNNYRYTDSYFNNRYW